MISGNRKPSLTCSRNFQASSRGYTPCSSKFLLHSNRARKNHPDDRTFAKHGSNSLLYQKSCPHFYPSAIACAAVRIHANLGTPFLLKFSKLKRPTGDTVSFCGEGKQDVGASEEEEAVAKTRKSWAWAEEASQVLRSQ